MKKGVFAIAILLSCDLAQAQLPISNELRDRLEHKSTFREIMTTVNDYYVEKDYANNPEILREFKKWNRWAWWESRHLDQSGNFVSTEQQYAALQPVIKQAKEEEERDNRSNSGVWSSIGPYEVPGGIGRVDRLAFHPTDPNHIYAGTPGSGTSWIT